jgi:hypothetical protein
MNITALFCCESVDGQTGDDPVETVKFRAAIAEENKSFSKWTPSGDLSLTVTNPDVIGKFVIGELYRIDISPAPELRDSQS